MIWNYGTKDTRHKVFISYYHGDDEYYKDQFERLFGHLFINKSIALGDIASDNSTEYVKRLIQEGYITDSSVVVVLVGPNTWKRKHVDWEISAGLNKKVGGYSGLLGLCLPNHPNYSKDKYNADFVPPRLVDNLKSGYAKFFDWTEDATKVQNWIEEAFRNRIDEVDKINNSREQYKYNRI